MSAGLCKGHGGLFLFLRNCQAVERRRGPSDVLDISRPLSWNAPGKFWVVGRSDIPSYSCSPWKFYERFLTVKDHHLVLCNDKADVRVMTGYPVGGGLTIAYN
jgi:hypothetical protein